MQAESTKRPDWWSGIPRFGVAPAATLLALRSSDDLLTYDLSAGTLAPAITVNTGWSGYPVAVSSDARFLATLEFPTDFSTPPFIQVRDGVTGAPAYRIDSQPARHRTDARHFDLRL